MVGAMQEPTEAKEVFARVIAMKADFLDGKDDSIPGKFVRMSQDKMWLKMPDADNAAKSIATIEEATKLLDEAHRSLATVEDGLGPKLERLLRATQRSEASCNKFQGLVTECTGALITRAKALSGGAEGSNP